MNIPFSERPGRHERHFRRKLDASLFPRPTSADDTEALLESQRLDHEELLQFLQSLRALVARAAQLKPNEDTQVVLDLKGELEKHYELACGLADQQGNNKQAIAQLIEVIMASLRRNTVGDALAEQELNDEVEARRLHFQLLEQPLVADLLHPQTLIESDELVPVLLTDPVEQVEAALFLFDEQQRDQLVHDARELLQARGLTGDQWQTRLALLQA